MSIASTDIVLYGAASISESDATATQGGAIATTVRYVFDSSTLVLALATTLKVVSSAAGDTTQTVLVTGRSASGAIITETFTLNGTTVQTGVVTFQRISKVTVSGSHTGTISVKRSTDSVLIVAIETGVLECRRLFISAFSDVSGGSAKAYYEKVFIKNTNATLDLLSATVAELLDTQGIITFDLESSLNGTNSVASRLNTAPTSMLGSFDNSTKNVPTGSIPATQFIGCWLKLQLIADAVAVNDSYSIRTSGQTI